MSTEVSPRLDGLGVSDGLAYGQTVWLDNNVVEPLALNRDSAVTVESAFDQLHSAITQVEQDYLAVLANLQGEGKDVLEATVLILKDPTWRDNARQRIEQGRTVERAVWEAAGEVADQLASLGGYFAERVSDLMDVRDRVLLRLAGRTRTTLGQAEAPVVVLGVDLAPSDTVTFSPETVAAIVTQKGGAHSHTAILARNLGIPAVVGLADLGEEHAGQTVMVDGGQGSVVFNPSAGERATADQWQADRLNEAPFTGSLALASGENIALLSNVGTEADARKARDLGLQGVGLFRTELLYLDAREEPSVQNQAERYGAVFAAMSELPVTVRTIDAGSDKYIEFLNNESEPNPALGVRGYRLDKVHPGVLDRQLEAIAHAASTQSVVLKVMAPMVSTATEARDFAAKARSCGITKPGVMIEVPSAALMAKEILREVEFASIGTNDLVQYLLASDRQIAELDYINSFWQVAVIRVLGSIAQARDDVESESGRKVGLSVCGESASDPYFAAVLVGLGYRELSLSAPLAAKVARLLSVLTLEQCQQAATQALNSETADEARQAVRDVLTND